MNKIIKKAIQGAYTDTRNKYIVTVDGMFISYSNSIVLDPLFWQALGKACGWNMNPKSIRFGDSNRESLGEHIDYALRFHETNLTEGWDKAVKYLSDLTTS